MARVGPIAPGPRARQRALAIGISDQGELGDPLAELKELLRTAGVATVGEAVQQRPKPDPDRYFGRGKLDRAEGRRSTSSDANLVACDDELAPRQERNLEAALGVPVIDRTAVILDIFADHAHSAEGKLQVELAQLEYNLARMRGLWTHLERLGGGIGTRGPGESQIETDRRLARDRIAALRRRLERLQRNRGVMRARRERSSIPRVALAGYTNAGKSTLLNAITGAEVGVGDQALSHPRPDHSQLRALGPRLPPDRHGGLHREAPASACRGVQGDPRGDGAGRPDRARGRRARPLKSDAWPICRPSRSCSRRSAPARSRSLLVLNKADLLDAEARLELSIRHPEAVLVSALEGEGLGALREAIEGSFDETLTEVELLVPYADGARLHELHEVAGDLVRTEREDGVLVRARLPDRSCTASWPSPQVQRGERAPSGCGPDRARRPRAAGSGCTAIG